MFYLWVRRTDPAGPTQRARRQTLADPAKRRKRLSCFTGATRAATVVGLYV